MTASAKALAVMHWWPGALAPSGVDAEHRKRGGAAAEAADSARA